MADDKTTIGVTSAGASVLETLAQRGLFIDQMDAAKFAISLAIRLNVVPGEMNSAGTKWNVGSFDKEGHLRVALLELYPDEKAPYRLAEFLIDKGLSLLSEELKANPDLDVRILQKRLRPSE